ncbi:MAG TPA: T9SS type A sorting domain-containing protein, partial [Bacteroidales bacterium]|nr:T9SS type A sorting domain-containing protein [Bacteroidales bacterium]
NAVIKIYDVMGRIVYKNTFSESPLSNQKIIMDLQSLPSGIYSAEFVAGEYSNTSKIVKNY